MGIHKDTDWVLIRYNLNKDFTEGVLISVYDNKEICDTLEDAVRDANANGVFDGDEKKVYGKTAIPYGMYVLTVTYSNRFKRDMVLVNDVPEFTGIRMHYGKTANNSEGCILVGEKMRDGMLKNIGMTDVLVDMVNEKGKVILQII